MIDRSSEKVIREERGIERQKSKRGKSTRKGFLLLYFIVAENR